MSRYFCICLLDFSLLEFDDVYHILFLGVACNSRDRFATFTEDGFEMTFGTNHLGHFLLTMLLLDDLKKSGPDSRVVVVASELHNPSGRNRKKPAHIDFENLQLLVPGTFDSMVAYKNSKLANVLFSYELDRQLHGSGVTCNAVCPGFVPETQLIRNNKILRCMLICCFRGCFRCLPIARSKSRGAEGVVFVASDHVLQGVGGKYFRNCIEQDSSPESMDREVAAKLWKLSSDLLQINLSPRETDNVD